MKLFRYFMKLYSAYLPITYSAIVGEGPRIATRYKIPVKRSPIGKIFLEFALLVRVLFYSEIIVTGIDLFGFGSDIVFKNVTN